MLHNNDSRAFFARMCIVSSFIIGLAAIPTSASAASCTLAYSMTPKASVIQSGGMITYAVTVKNIGGGICRDVAYSIYYAPNETFASATPAPRAGNYYWYIGSLSSGKRATATVTTQHNSLVSGMSVDTEGCASGRNTADSCASSSVSIVVSTQSTPTTTQVVATSTIPTATQPTNVTMSTTTQSVTTPTTSMAQPTITSGKEQGIWVWNYPSQMNTAIGANQLRSLASKGFNVIYMTIDDYIDIASLPDSSAKDAQKAAYFSTLSQVIQKANSLGMTVDAEAGWRDWAYQSNRWKGFALIDAMKEYNQKYPNAKIRNFQYDVEPYLLPEYETNKDTVLADYVSFVDQSVQRLVGSDINLSLSIPHFYDDKQAWTPAFAYGGVTTYTFNHLLRILEKKPGSEILLMSYRDFFAGANGTQEISQVEIQEATAGHYATNIIVGQETGNVDPAFVTFYGSTQTVVLNMLSTISSSFGSYANFGGTAVHYMDSFLAMPQ